jgi:hypothetical protein
MILKRRLIKLTRKVRADLHGPAKMVELMVNTPSDGTSSVAVVELDEHAAFHAARNARVSLPEPLPDAPNALTSNTFPQAYELFVAAGGSGGGGGRIGFDAAGGCAGGFADTAGATGGFAVEHRGGWAGDGDGDGGLAGASRGGLTVEAAGGCGLAWEKEKPAGLAGAVFGGSAGGCASGLAGETFGGWAGDRIVGGLAGASLGVWACGGLARVHGGRLA